MSATFKKAAPRRTHRERSAPAGRSKFGILERHKDYIQRAKNYHFKEKRLNAMKEAARFKNPDEFYFGMIKAKIKDGKHTKDQASILSTELTALADSHSLSFVNAHLHMNLKQISKLRSQFVPTSTPTQHILFNEMEEGTTFKYIPANSQFDGVANYESKSLPSDESITSIENGINQEEQYHSDEHFDKDHVNGNNEVAKNDNLGPAGISDLKHEKNKRELQSRLMRQEALIKVAARLRVRTHAMSQEKKEKVSTTPSGFPVFKFAQVRKQ